MTAKRKPKVRVVPFRPTKGPEKGKLRYRWLLVVNGQPIAGDQSQGYDRRHRAREMGEAVVSGAYADYELDDPGAGVLEDDG